jgi:Cu2+-containing amine oxidase
VNEIHNLWDIVWKCSRCKKEFSPNNKIRQQAIRRKATHVYCSRECLNKRRVDTSDSNLLFCYYCKMYKKISEYYSKRIICKSCHKKQADEIHHRDPSLRRENQKRYYLKEPEKKRALSKKHRIKYVNMHRNEILEKAKQRNIELKNTDPERYALYKHNSKAKDIAQLKRRYVVDILKNCNKPVNETTIELRRQQIILKRTLKQLYKLIREKEHESDRDFVSRQQHKNEEVNEGHRGNQETGHGGDCGLSA